jgi:hypothetical protein
MFDESSSIENDPTDQKITGNLGELALRTGGEIIHVPNHVFEADGQLGLVNQINIHIQSIDI